MPFPIHSIALFDDLLICVESIQGSLFQNCCVQSLVHGTRQLGRIKFSNPSSVVGRCWITEFIRSDKKSEVYCIFGQEIEINQLGKVRVDYSIGKLDITEFVVHAEAKLEMLFAEFWGQLCSGGVSGVRPCLLFSQGVTSHGNLVGGQTR